MKKVLKILSVVCLLVAVITILMGAVALFVPANNWFAGYALFGLLGGKGFMGFIGNILGVVLTAACFGAMGFYGLQHDNSHSARKNALIWAGATSLIGVISLIIAIANKQAGFGDVLIALLPIAFGAMIIKDA